ncbi:MAG: LLM class flavin-dependent oxidoreductase [Deltaproteobacteria bacterium]|nr:LLM class flavin-dependent oxidoreductase [Deltaproteobacteria bacterium]
MGPVSTSPSEPCGATRPRLHRRRFAARLSVIRTAAAAVTARVRTGTTAIPARTRTLPVGARAPASCAELAPGRLVRGVGSSSGNIVAGRSTIPFRRSRARARGTASTGRALLAVGVTRTRYRPRPRRGCSSTSGAWGVRRATPADPVRPTASTPTASA